MTSMGAMVVMVVMGAMVEEAGDMEGALMVDMAMVVMGALMVDMAPRWEVLEAGVEVLHEGLPARGDVAAREEEVHDTMLRPTERIRVTHAGHEREPIKITNSSSGVPVLNVK